jgi:UDP:flavonoid glycosyltransferase YjiC (YdhE family)
MKLRLQRWLAIKTTSLRNAFTERRAVLRAYARRLGFPLSRLEQYGWITLFNFHQLPVLSLTARELDFPHTPPRWLRYVGPMVAAERAESRVESLTRTRLETVYAESRASGRPLLYCWLTTMETPDEGFLDSLLQAVARHPEWLVVVGFTGRNAADFSGLPAHVHAFDFVPQIEVLGEADLCITHGGVNTINECIQMQVPMLVYSTGFADKDGCAARLAYHGLCHRGDIHREGATEIAERIEAALADRGMPERLAAMRLKLERYRDERVLEHTVAGLLGRENNGPC